MRIRRLSHGSLAMVLLCSGCGGGPKLAQVEGRVLLDGKPQKNILVSFIPDTNQNTFGPNSTGITDEDGRYQLVCDEEDRRSGAIIGSHRVTLIDMDNVHPPDRGRPTRGLGATSAPSKSDRAKAGPKRRLSAKYMDWSRTPLQKQVAPGSQTIDFELTEASSDKKGGH